MENEDIVQAAGDENVNEFQRGFNGLVMGKIADAVDGVRQDILDDINKPGIEDGED